jgi:hypothetical protein
MGCLLLCDLYALYFYLLPLELIQCRCSVLTAVGWSPNYQYLAFSRAFHHIWLLTWDLNFLSPVPLTFLIDPDTKKKFSFWPCKLYITRSSKGFLLLLIKHTYNILSLLFTFIFSKSKVEETLGSNVQWNPPNSPFLLLPYTKSPLILMSYPSTLCFQWYAYPCHSLLTSFSPYLL